MTPFSLPFGKEWWMLALVETAAIVIDYPSEHLSLVLVARVVCSVSSVRRVYEEPRRSPVKLD